MNQNLIEFEKHIRSVITSPYNDRLLYYSDADGFSSLELDILRESGRMSWEQQIPRRHCEGYFNRVLEEYNLSPKETKTAWLFDSVFTPLLEIDFPWDREEIIGKSSKQGIYDGLKEDWHRVYDEIDLCLMSDEELVERLKNQWTEGDYKYDYANQAFYHDAWTIVKAYLCGRTSISYNIYNKISKIIECSLSQKNPMYRLEGLLMEEMEYRKDMEKMSRETSELYTYDTVIYGAPMGLGETTQTTKGWQDYSQVEGFESAFNQFIEAFKQARKEHFEQKMKEYEEAGNTLSRLVLLNKTDGFAESIEILENI